MSAESIKSLFEEELTERFFFVGGRTDDEFCTLSLKLCNVEELLHDHLKGLGYDLIAYYAATGKGLYFYDSESYDTWRNPKNSKKEPDKTKKRSKIVSGPIGVKIKRDRNSTQKQQERIQKTDSLKLQMSETNMLTNVDRMMKNSDVKTAIVFSNWEDFVTHSDQGILRNLSQKLTEWKKLNSSNENIMIFIIPEITMKRIREVDSRSSLNTLELFDPEKENQLNFKRVIWLSVPNIDEIEYLVRYKSFKNSIDMDWKSYEESISLLTRWVKTEGNTLKKLSRRLNSMHNFSKNNIETLIGIKDKKRGFERFDDLIGMDKAKEQIRTLVEGIKNSVDMKQLSIKRREGKDVQRLYGKKSFFSTGVNLHFALIGNPGTGKTTLAKIIAEILQDEGLLETGHMVKVTRDDLVSPYVGNTAIKTKEKIDQAMGGVLFIDEAYTLVKKGDQENNNDFGQEAVDTLVESLSDREGMFSAIIAGYPEDIERFIASNKGLERRFFNVIYLEDYPPEVLEEIFRKQMQQHQMVLDDEMEKLLSGFMQNWFDARDPENFGNAGAVEDLFNKMKHSARRERRDVLSKRDIPEELQRHAKPLNSDSLEEIQKKLDAYTGLYEVKETVRKIVNQIKINQLEPDQKEIIPGHYIFHGNPGTGKTTIARLFAEILKELKVIKRGQLVEVSAKDLVSKYNAGDTKEKTRKALESALGGMLFIDEAYTLLEQGGFGQSAIGEIVSFMENNKENLSIVFAGYDQEMEEFVDSNAGLERRIYKKLHFSDYSSDELLEIFHSFAKKEKWKYSDKVESRLIDLFEYRKIMRGEKFGNAGEVEKIVREINENRADRLFKLDIKDANDERFYQIELEDLPYVPEEHIRHSAEGDEAYLDRAFAKLDDIVGLEGVKAQIRSIVDTIRANQKRGGGEVVPGHYVFAGNPGTGKTTVARIFGEILRELKVLQKGHFVEVTREDLVAGYQGQTAIKTKEELEKSLGGVLFIDEAYSLINDDRDSFGKEAINTIIPFMDNHRSEFTLIAAGYPDEMNDFINNSNSGMKTRIDTPLKFEDYSAEEMVQIFKIFAKKQDFVLGDGVEEYLIKLFDDLKKSAGDRFGNGRDARKIFESSVSALNSRIAPLLDNIEKEDKILRTIEIVDLSISHKHDNI